MHTSNYLHGVARDIPLDARPITASARTICRARDNATTPLLEGDPIRATIRATYRLRTHETMDTAL